MAKFTLKAFVFALLMFFCVLFGMQLANDGIITMRGFDDPTLKDALTVEGEQEDLQVSVLGNDINSHDLEKKKDQLEEMKSFNFFSNLGKTLASAISSLLQALIDTIYDVIKGSGS